MSFIFSKSCVHAKDVLCSLFELKESGRFCDVTLIAEDRQIHAHRVVLATTSSYFAALLDGPFLESSQPEIELKGMDGAATETLVRFIYTGQFEITPSTAQSLLIVSDMLQLLDAKEACCEFLIHNLSTENCLETVMFSERHSCASLKSAAVRWGEEHFGEITESGRYLSLPAHALAAFLSSDRLNAVCETQVYNCVTRWVAQRQSEGGIAAAGEEGGGEEGRIGEEGGGEEGRIGEDLLSAIDLLVECIRLPCLPVEFLIETASTNTILLQSAKYRSLLDKTKSFHIMANLCVGYNPSRCDLNKRHRVGCYTNVVYILGGDEGHQKLEMYDPSGLQSQELSELPSCRVGAAVAKLGRYIHVIGGKNRDGLVLNSVVKFCSYNNTWTNSAGKVNECRSSAAAAVLDGKLYVCGGYNGYITLSSVEVLNPTNESWKAVAPMNQRRKDFGLMAINNRLWAVGGLDDSGGNPLTVECYSSANHSWTTVTPPHHGKRSGISCCALDHLIYIVSHNTLERYNTQSNTWVEISKKELLSLNDSSCVSIGEHLYIFGGTEKLNSVDKVYRYDVHSDTWNEVPAMIHPRAKCSVVNV